MATNYGYDPQELMRLYNAQGGASRVDPEIAAKQTFGQMRDLGNGYWGIGDQFGGVTIAGLNNEVGSKVYTWSPDGKGGYTPFESTVEAPSKLGNLLAKVTPAVVGGMFAGAAGFGPFSPTSSLGAGAGTSASYLGAADAAGGLMPEFGSISAYDAASAGSPALTSGASSLASTAASGAGEVASSVAADQLPNEMAKLLAQNAAPAGTLMNTALPTVATGGGVLSGLMDAAGSVLGSKAGSAVVGGLLSGLAGANAPKSTTATSTTQLDPRMAEILYGSNGNNGFLSKIVANSNAPQNAGMQAFGQGMDAYLKDYGRGEFDNNMRGAAALRDMRFDAPQAQAAQVQAPSQNNLNLSPAYQDMIYGQAGSNPHLTGAIQKGINQSNYAFGNYMSDATKATQDLLGNIRGGAVLNNTMGSSRQGIAEGRAIGDLTQNLGRAATQFGMNNTDAAVAAQAGAYDADRNRQLAAMQGLNQSQYGVAQQNAQMAQQANLANAQMKLATNQQNANNLQAGIGMSSGLLGQAVGYGQNQDQYQSQKLGQTAGLLAPFTGLGATQTQTQPLYQNTLGNIAGGAMAGLGIYNMFNK